MNIILKNWSEKFFSKYHMCNYRRVNIPIILSDLEEIVMEYARDTANKSLEIYVKDLLQVVSALPDGFVLCSVDANFDWEARHLRATKTVTKLITLWDNYDHENGHTL